MFGYYMYVNGSHVLSVLRSPRGTTAITCRLRLDEPENQKQQETCYLFR